MGRNKCAYAYTHFETTPICICNMNVCMCGSFWDSGLGTWEHCYVQMIKDQKSKARHALKVLYPFYPDL